MNEKKHFLSEKKKRTNDRKENSDQQWHWFHEPQQQTTFTGDFNENFKNQNQNKKTNHIWIFSVKTLNQRSKVLRATTNSRPIFSLRLFFCFVLLPRNYHRIEFTLNAPAATCSGFFCCVRCVCCVFGFFFLAVPARFKWTRSARNNSNKTKSPSGNIFPFFIEFKIVKCSISYR